MKLRSMLILGACVLLLGCGREAAPAADSHGHGDEAGHAAEAEEPEKGPHGGRLLRDGEFALELAIYERGVPPEFRVWLYRGEHALAPPEARVSVNLQRLGKPAQRFSFAPREDYLVGDAVVEEPHSFDVEVLALASGQESRWHYASYEGRVRIAAAVAQEAGIRVAPAGPGSIRDEHDVQGLLTVQEDRHARVAARFEGPVLAVHAAVGDRVSRGQVLAEVESNLNLRRYQVLAPLAGTVLARAATVGELAGGRTLFEIADLSQLWVDLHLFGGDAQHITPGLPVQVTRLNDGASLVTALERVLPSTATASQSTVARAPIDNADGQWRPGAAVRARVTVAETAVPLVVPLAALQRFRDWDVVFERIGEDYEIRPLTLGRRDGVQAEVQEGLDPGAQIVVEQSYLIKADIEKSGASHDH